MHDTIETFATFATRIDGLCAEWVTNIRPELHANNIRTVQSAATTLFGDPWHYEEIADIMRKRVEAPTLASDH